MGDTLGYGFAGFSNGISPMLQTVLLEKYKTDQARQLMIGKYGLEAAKSTGDQLMGASSLSQLLGQKSTTSQPLGAPVGAMDASSTSPISSPMMAGSTLGMQLGGPASGTPDYHEARAAAFSQAFPTGMQGSVDSILKGVSTSYDVKRKEALYKNIEQNKKLYKGTDLTTAIDLGSKIGHTPQEAATYWKIANSDSKALDVNSPDVQAAISSGKYEIGRDKKGKEILEKVKEPKSSNTNPLTQKVDLSSMANKANASGNYIGGVPGSTTVASVGGPTSISQLKPTIEAYQSLKGQDKMNAYIEIARAAGHDDKTLSDPNKVKAGMASLDDVLNQAKAKAQKDLTKMNRSQEGRNFKSGSVFTSADQIMRSPFFHPEAGDEIIQSGPSRFHIKKSLLGVPPQ